MEENGECFFGIFTRRHGDVIESWVTCGVFFHTIELAGRMPRVVIPGINCHFGGLWAWQVTARLLLLVLRKTGPNKILIFFSRTIFVQLRVFDFLVIFFIFDLLVQFI